MALPTNAVDTYTGATSNREAFIDAIYNVSMMQCPFLTEICKRTTTTGITHQWQTVTLRAPAANARIDGDDVGTLQNTVSVRPTNVTQISTLAAGVSGTQEAVNKAGNKSEYAKQVAYAYQNIMRDMEAILSGNQAPATGATNTARQLRPLEGWYSTNVSRGGSGANGTASAAATDGTQRAFTRTLFETVQQSIFNNAGPGTKTVMMGPAQKLVFETFDWYATVKRQDTSDGRLTAALEIIATSFGEVKVVLNAFSRARTVHILDNDMWEVPFLRELQDTPLAKSGDSERFMVLAEYTLQASNERASGVIADLT
jgi:hypothetical protein